MSRIFDGTLTSNIQTLSIPDSASMRQTGAITIAAWVKFAGRPVGQTVGAIYSKYPDNATAIGMDFTIHNSAFTSTPYFLDVDFPCVTGYSGTVSDVGVTPNVWQHVAFTWDPAAYAGQIQTFINGVITGISQPHANTNAPRADVSGHPVTIGNDNFAGKFDGEIADLRMWDTALTTAEVLSILTGGTPQSAHLKLRLPIVGNLAPEPDVSGYDNNATVVNAPTQGDTSYGFSTSRPPVSTVVDGSRVRVSWLPVYGASGYKVYRTSTQAGDATLLGTVGAGTLKYTDSSPVAGYAWYEIVPEL